LIKNAEASVFFVKRNDLQQIIESLEEDKNKIQIRLAEFQGDVSSKDQAYEDLKVKIPPMREKSYSLNTELERLNMTVENLKQEELRFEEHKANLEHRVKQLEKDLQVEVQQYDETNLKLNEINREINEISSKDFDSTSDNSVGQSDRSLLNNISFDKKYENSVAAIFGKELLASLDKDEVFYWTENIQDIQNSKFSFNCKLASDVIKSPQRILSKLSNVAIVNNKDEGYENHKYLKPGQAIVDLEGNLWRWDGLFISSSYESNISSILAELKEKRLNDLKKQIIEWERILEITNQKIHDLKDRIKTANEELEISQNNPGDIDSKRQFLLNKIKELDDEKKLFDNQLQEQENLLEKLSKELRNKEQNYSVVKEELIRKESEISNYSNNLNQLSLSCREKINVDLLNLENEIEKFKKDEDLDTAEKRVFRLVAERERIGAVNLLAEDEYSKLREKVDETIKDKNEIQESIEKLHEAINKINKEGVTRLRDAFKIVNENFERLFTKLFGGGKANLKLIQDDEDPLNSGLEIFASPPGKKMQNITLLSGGEQALTAISLLFAVFMANPSPFCILDEVDAPLDDNNVDRFCSMVEEISQKVQTKFIIITHNRMTMSRVDRLYGVTMPEEGVSQIVSVELEEAVKYAE
jgi:chromosome segregation protein